MRQGKIMLEPLLRSKTKEKILLYLFVHGESYPRKIASGLKIYLSAVQRQLSNLERGRVLSSKLKGKVRLFHFNPKYPFRKELEALLEKTLKLLPEKEKKKLYKKRKRVRRNQKIALKRK